MKLEAIKTIEGKIRLLTGLHIGASNENIEIGGMDNPVIKDPMPYSKAPYIPGSSLKGKLRSLIEIKEGRHTNGKPCDCAKPDCSVCAVFGTAASKRNENLGPTRIMVRDAYLTEKWMNTFLAGELPMETKYENSINRITGEANPRPLERVPATVEFDFHISFKVFETDSSNYFNTILKAMRLLELDALGGAGSRGCGQIKFIDVKIDGQTQADDFLESVILSN